MTKGIIEDLLKKEDVQAVVESQDFYFQKGQDALNKWLAMQVPEELKNELLELSENYHNIPIKAAENEAIKNIIDLLFEIISYCDSRAKDKNTYNQYEDKRAVAMASVRMTVWIPNLVLHKFSRENLGEGSPKNAFNYLLDPENNITILSQNHRKLISEKLLQKPFNSLEFVNDLRDYFSQYSINCLNTKNYTHLLSLIVYAIQDDWKEEVVALMASDGTGWQDNYIKEFKTQDAGILWNSRRPTGTNETIGFLKSIVKEGSTFNLYYCSGGWVNYKVTVLDFVEDQTGLDKKKWNSSYKRIKDFQTNFSDYADANKEARVVFLISSFEKLNPIPVSEFKFYKKFQTPRQDNLSPVKFEPETTPINESETKATKQIVMNENKWPLNQILFGPPGTGKTYNTINKAIAIANPSFDLTQTREIVKAEFDRLMNTGQIVFTTFHQSMSYEDFIEGIKPIVPKEEGQAVNYKVIDGIFKRLCKSAGILTSSTFELSYAKFMEVVKSSENGFVFNVDNDEIIISPHPNGSDLSIESKAPISNISKEGLKYVSDSQRFVGVWGKYYKSIFKVLADKYGYQADKKDFNRNYVIIIDEINRGNVSQIFGELITLIEDDKRLGKEEALEVTLPYSKEKFGVPANVYLIGTMNTADRSVEALDAALRRRFSFEEMPPKPELIAADGKLKEQEGILEGIDLAELLKVMNRRIEKLLDKDHQIGHSYFMSVSSLEELKAAFQNKIIPLLQEYFFGDYGKIGLVLGEGFFEKPDNEETINVFSGFFGYTADELAERPIYRLKNCIALSSDDFIHALEILMKKQGAK